MFDKLKEMNKLRHVQADMKKQLENIFASYDKGGLTIVIRGDKHIEKLLIDGEEDKQIKDALNSVMKDVDKKVEKQMRGKLGDLGIPGL